METKRSPELLCRYCAQQNSMQGDMLCAVDEIRELALTGNEKFGKYHVLLLFKIKKTLLSSKLFDRRQKREIRRDIRYCLKGKKNPNMAAYDHLQDIVCQWCSA
jgi:hypothetical protein